jgi:hypothetical protein
MPSILDTLSGHLDDNALRQISSRLGADQGATSKAIAAAVPLLLGALAHNTTQGDGAQRLNDALARDHDGSVLNDVGGTLQNAPLSGGEAILGHVLGDRRDVAEQAVARSSGLDASKAGPLLATLAPLVLGALGRVRQERGLDANGLAGLLGGEREALTTSAPGVMGAVSRLLDRNKDGSVIDDVGGMLGSLFGKR